MPRIPPCCRATEYPRLLVFTETAPSKTDYRSLKQSPLPMPLDRQFVKAEIEKRNETCYILTVFYSWYWFVEYKVVSVHPSLQVAKDALLIERSRDHLKIVESEEKKEHRV